MPCRSASGVRLAPTPGSRVRGTSRTAVSNREREPYGESGAPGVRAPGCALDRDAASTLANAEPAPRNQRRDGRNGSAPPCARPDASDMAHYNTGMKHADAGCTEMRRAGLFALRHAADLVENFIDSKLGAVGLSIPKLAALERLEQAGGSLPLGQLAARLACVKSNVTQLVDRLESDGLVERAPDLGDRRSRLAVLTPLGRDAYARGSAILAEAEEHVFATLSPDEKATLAELVAKLEPIRR